MTLSLVRVDDRLIHGQVIAVWLRALNAEVIVIADDETANDEFLREILELAAPPGVEVEVHSVEDAVQPISELSASDIRTIVLMKSPTVARDLVLRGAPIETLNIGGMGAAEGRSTLYKNVSARPEELEAMRYLEQHGTKVEIQIVADDSPTAFSSVDPGKKAGATP
ncbi:PTS system mannose/fructose/N-acetylgalactosamine-transporter subunit IIB [Humidisolicoccus flavus]|uniref:PTS system mannose/fructose/N-acetylgalactosamine-transporter subunit IIB n=1 Tax=Humidisolicoccus flavus TaxID=3111414 RepID=UPI003254F241